MTTRIVSEPGVSQPSKNAPCPCGSGKKFKRCCGADAGAAPAGSATTAPAMDIAKGALKFGDIDRARAAIAPLLDKATCRDANVWSMAARIEAAGRRFSQAADYAAHAAKLEPDNLRHRYNYGSLLSMADRKAEAADTLSAVVAAKPGMLEARINLANAQRDLGRMSDAIENYVAVARSPGVDLELLNHALTTLHLYDLDDEHLRYRLHCLVGDRIAAEAPVPPPATIGADRQPQRRLRIGYLSPRFSREIVGYFLKPILTHHDRSRVELFLYSATKRPDDLTDWFRDFGDSWRDVVNLSDRSLCDLIAGDQLDILIDLAGHAPENRLRAIAGKPAPVIVSMLDYFDTTGVPTIDYFVTDSVSTPLDSPQTFREKLIRMSQPRLVYEPPDYAPEVNKRTDAKAPIVFGSFNRSHKITDRVITLWSQLLDAVEGSRLILKASTYRDPSVCDELRRRFVERGIDAGRLAFRVASPHREMLDEYNDIDIALDTFPYNGGLTTAEALWMGTPVLTLVGSRLISRQSAAFLTAVGLEDWAADRDDEFVEVGRHWAAHRAELRALQTGLRDRLATSPLTDGHAFTRELEEHLFAAFTASHKAGAT